ncbi:hypothetical protein MSG28_015822 [Choristoneura fumiferana]|uniref:Uncharacterized protein n=1 Tax=Choristoneura fumiferana TaxID=7141 RepID=A0ACC0KCW0_CHOFU|nr:hypothetical protein MSG28_015822 [Choristoneura fumiferana]
MTTLRNTLFNSLLRKENICCLCLNVAEQNTILIRDEVLLNGNDFECNVFSEILGYILGDDKCRANFQSFNQVLESLDKCLQDASEQINMCKSLFVVLDPNDAAQHYYDYKRPIATQAVALKRFNSILSGKNSKPNLEIKNEDDFDGNSEDPPFNEDVIKVKETKKKRARKTVNLPRELILHEDSQPLAYKCNVCLKTFTALDYLRQHYLRLHAPKTVKCPKCDRSYGSNALMEQHIQDCHDTRVCSICGKVYNNRHALKQHELGHRMRYVCQKCGRVYKNKDTFKQHIGFGVCGQVTRKSAFDGQFKCDICNKQYSRKNTLRVHIKFEHSETGTPHVCSWCNKKFSCQSRLKAHTVKHTQEKNFSCETCGGKFVTKESLLYHTRIHTGERPYKCSYCSLSYLSSSRRAEHVRRHHKDPNLFCDICGTKFKTRSSLQKHKQRHGNPNKQPARVDKARPQLEKAKPGLRKLLIDNSKNPDFIIGTSFTLIS